MNTKIVQDGRIPIYSFVDGNPPMTTVKYAGGIDPNFNGEPIFVIDWKIDGEKVYVVYQTRNDLYAPVYDGNFPLISVTTPLPKPGRNFEWNSFSSCWRNVKTGQRIPVY